MFSTTTATTTTTKIRLLSLKMNTGNRFQILDEAVWIESLCSNGQMYHSQIRPCVKWTYNIHIYIYNTEQRNLEIRKTRNDFSVQVRNFLLPLSLKVLWHKERETPSFYSGFFICTPQHVWHPPLRSPWASKSQPSSLEAGLISTNWLFQNLPKSTARFRCMTSFALASLRFPSRAIVTSLSDTSALRVRVNTCVNVAPN